jgi:16S rRNA (cytosine967-C5)-methyltransferase
MPEWLVRRWMENYGRDETIKLLQFAQSTPELTIRVCEMSITVEGYEQILRGRNIQFHRSKLVPSCLIIDSKKQGSPEKLPGYSDGLFTVQDESAALVSKVVDAKPGKEVIVDLCAAPGGKSLHMAEMMENSGRVIAVDKHASRLNLLKENRQRLGLTNIEIVAADGRSFTLEKPADRVLLDAPCTGTGVVNRRSDLRFRREAVDIGSLTELQRELLNNAADLVKPGGVLVYATCSIEPEENFDNIRWFMRERSDFEGEDLTPFLPQHLQEELHSCWTGPACKTESEMTTPFMLQLLPSRHGVSGFFICRLRKKL